METICFLDLEETIIDSWQDFNFVNIKSVNKFIKTLPKDTHFGLFSYAIYNDSDLFKFKKVQRDIERVFNFTFTEDLMWTIEDIMDNVRKSKPNLKFDHLDFFDFFDKETALISISKLKEFKDTRLILLDDTVQDIKIENSTNQNIVEFVDVTRI